MLDREHMLFQQKYASHYISYNSILKCSNES